MMRTCCSYIFIIVSIQFVIVAKYNVVSTKNVETIQRLQYPELRRDDTIIDDYYGTKLKGSDTDGNKYYVMRTRFLEKGIVVGKYTAKGARISYGGVEYGIDSKYDVLLHKNYCWGEVADDATKWIPGGIDQLGNVIYICQAQMPRNVDMNQHTVPGRYENSHCYISWNGLEIAVDKGFKVLRQSLL